jgi:hypothetical protein
MALDVKILSIDEINEFLEDGSDETIGEGISCGDIYILLCYFYTRMDERSDGGCLIFIIIYVGLNRFTIYILYGWRH